MLGQTMPLEWSGGSSNCVQAAVSSSRANVGKCPAAAQVRTSIASMPSNPITATRCLVTIVLDPIYRRRNDPAGPLSQAVPAATRLSSPIFLRRTSAVCRVKQHESIQQIEVCLDKRLADMGTILVKGIAAAINPWTSHGRA